VLTAPVLAKLRFVHDLVQAGKGDRSIFRAGEAMPGTVAA